MISLHYDERMLSPSLLTLLAVVSMLQSALVLQDMLASPLGSADAKVQGLACLCGECRVQGRVL